jgi:CRP-like cAMP-binding protein
LEGAPADELYLIADGEVLVTTRAPGGQVPLSRLSDGELFGEIGLLAPQRRRSARVTATKPLLVSCLSHAHFERLLDRFPEARAALQAAAEQALVRSFVRRASPFEKLSAENLAWLASRLTTRELPAGAFVFKQGETGDLCYLVRSGALEILRQEDKGERRVGTLGPGDFVGEAALLTGAPRDASLRTLEPSSLLGLGRPDLLRVLGREEKIAGRVVELMRERERPVQAERVVVHTRPNPEGGTSWLLEDMDRFGTYHPVSALGYFVWKRLDGNHNVEELAAEYRQLGNTATPEQIAALVAEMTLSGFAHAKPLSVDTTAAVTRGSLWDRVRRFFAG